MPDIWTALKNPVPGSRVAVYPGTPGSTVTLPGVLRRLLVVESFGSSLALPGYEASFGSPLVADGLALWVEAFSPTTASGQPVVQTPTEILTAWNSLRTALQASSYEFFTHYLPGDSPFYRKYKSVSTVLLRSQWSDPLGVVWSLAAITSDKTLAITAEGEV